jgi:hypothetical protein
MPNPDLRSIIDSIALEVTEAGIDGDAESLEQSISERTTAHLLRALKSGAMTKAGIDRYTPMIIRGVLRRLEEIATGGGQIGSA